MATKQKYRLEALVRIKERAKRSAEIELAKAIAHLNEQKEKLKKLESEKEKIQNKIANERREMSDRMHSGEALAKHPQSHLNFIQKYKDDLVEVEKKIVEQKKAITQAERRVQRARGSYMIAAQEHNMMLKHKELWQKQQAAALSAVENKMLNEIGNVIHQMTKAAR